MNSNISNMKIETDTFVYIICVAAFIGYTLGIQHAVVKIHKTEQQSNKVHKITQTNLSELAELLTLNNMMIDRVQQYSLNDEVTYNLNIEDSKNENDDHLVEPKVECEDEVINSNKYNENVPDNVPDNVANNSGSINSPEEEYEVITDSIKKLDLKKKQYYFGWFDSMF